MWEEPTDGPIVERPYRVGDWVVVATDDDLEAVAVVRSIAATDSLDPTRRWRVTVRFLDDDGVPPRPFHCDAAGDGPGLRRLPPPVSIAASTPGAA